MLKGLLYNTIYQKYYYILLDKKVLRLWDIEERKSSDNYQKLATNCQKQTLNLEKYLIVEV
ncbi:MAG: hypothetical protein AAGJ08_17995 [Cyanobacteria bacterium P01_H01_bin.35]